ncbi:DNA polymerase III subunit delta [Limisalsivibrio acetivorans]|uniref:DNA polymerase III subunit delta n=1 Tax=Limisalsivibrio acetivorans TaxID=1304888 RepID=UPI0003B45573|nr:DNA polymerase III subunit delta [Limisalsivibrio acetivorans]
MRHQGHEREREIFRKALQNNKLVHSYIFSGKEGSGKKHFALELARGLFCGADAFMADTDCNHAPKVEAKNHPDLHIAEEEKIPVATIREFNSQAYMSPLSAQCKVFIIDNAHVMEATAANAFLKTLEEPGADTFFFLITDKYDRILPTIRSRCVQVDFSALTDEDVRTVVEDIRPDAEGLDEAVKLASGSVSYALYLLDMGIADHGLPFGDMDGETLYRHIDTLKEKDDIRLFCSTLYRWLSDRYRESGDPLLLSFSNYLLEILRRLDYNVNLEIFKFDLFIKTAEVILERD